MKGSDMRGSNVRGVAIAGLAGLLLSGCAAQYRDHGYVPREDQLSQIVPGIDTRATVEDVVGVPSASSVRSGRGYYYVSSRMRSFAWREPEVVDREIVAISFDEGGVVRGIERYGLEDGRVVPLTRRVTENSGSDIGFIRRLFGNIGGLTLDNFGS